jgi:hypothetical protein
MNSSENLDRLIHGIATYNPLVLRNAGIITSLDEATEKYGGALGTTTTSVLDNTAAIENSNLALQQKGIDIEQANIRIAELQDHLAFLNTWEEKDATAISKTNLAIEEQQLKIQKLTAAIGEEGAELQELQAKHGTTATSSDSLAGSLTGQQKQLIMLNAVIGEGENIQGAYARAMEEPAKLIRSMPRYLYEWRREMGTHLLKAFRSWVGLLILGVKWLRGMTKEGKPVQRIMKALGRIFDAFLGTIAGGATGGALDSFEGALSRVADILETVATWVSTIFGGESSFAGGISGAGLTGTMEGPLEKLLQMLTGAAGLLAEGFWSWVTGPDGVMATMWDTMGGIIDSLKTWIDEKGPDIADKIIDWVAQFWAWITDPEDGVLVTLGTVLGNIITDIAKWIVENKDRVFEKIEEWATTFWSWVTGEGGVKGTLGTNLGTLISMLSLWINQNAGLVADAFIGIAVQFWGWALEAARAIAQKLGELFDAIKDWLGDESGGGTVMASVGTSIGEGIAKGVKKLFERDETGQILVLALIGSILKAMGSLAGLIEYAGSTLAANIVTGFVGELAGWSPVLKNAFQGYIRESMKIETTPEMRQALKMSLEDAIIMASGDAEEGLRARAPLIKPVDMMDILIRGAVYAGGPGGAGLRPGELLITGLVDDMDGTMRDPNTLAKISTIGEAPVKGFVSYFKGQGQIDLKTATENLIEDGILQPTSTSLLADSPSQVFVLFGQDIDQGLIDGMQVLKPSVESKAKELVKAVKKPFEDEDWKKLGKSIIEGIIDGIESKAAALARAAVKAARDALEAAQNEIESESPSKAFMRLGESMMEGMAQGVTQTSGLASAAAAGATVGTLGAAQAAEEHYHLHMSSNAETEQVLADFNMMRVMAGAA